MSKDSLHKSKKANDTSPEKNSNHDTYWDIPTRQDSLKKCIKLDAYLSAITEIYFKHLSKSMKCFDKMNKEEYNSIRTQLKQAFRKSYYFKTVKTIFKDVKETSKDNYLDDSIQIFLSTVTKSTSGAEPARLVKSKPLLPFLFFNYIIKHESIRNTISKRRKNYIENPQCRDSSKVAVSGLFKVADIEAHPKTLGSRYIKQFSTLLEILDSIDPPDRDPDIYSLLNDNANKLCAILVNYRQIAVRSEFIKRQELFFRIGQSLENQYYFIFFAYALALNSNLLKQFFVLNFTRLSKCTNEHYAETMQALIENGCLATAMHFNRTDHQFLSEAQLTQVLQQKAEAQKQFSDPKFEFSESLDNEIIELIKSKDLFNTSLPRDLLTCFSPNQLAVDTLDSVDEVNSLLGKLLNFHNAYSGLKNEQNNLNLLYFLTQIEDQPPLPPAPTKDKPDKSR